MNIVCDRQHLSPLGTDFSRTVFDEVVRIDVECTQNLNESAPWHWPAKEVVPPYRLCHHCGLRVVPTRLTCLCASRYIEAIEWMMLITVGLCIVRPVLLQLSYSEPRDVQDRACYQRCFLRHLPPSLRACTSRGPSDISGPAVRQAAVQTCRPATNATSSLAGRGRKPIAGAWISLGHGIRGPVFPIIINSRCWSTNKCLLLHRPLDSSNCTASSCPSLFLGFTSDLPLDIALDGQERRGDSSTLVSIIISICS